ncbi:MAG: hypothetical protein K2G20_10000 [Lachnospiraceae bacterium]|nr:hypothetical protein [Lachnospiraceae bacterium]
MLVLQIGILLLFMVAVPLGIGAGIASFVDGQKNNAGFMWMAGYLVLLAVFQFVSVPLVIKGARFSTLVLWFAVICILLFVAGIALRLQYMRRHPVLRLVKEKNGKREIILWAVFGALLLLQLFMAGYLTFADGDDAYFVTVATIADGTDTLYFYLPYTGGTTSLDMRHALAPFPLYIAFLARVTGLHTATVAHVALPMVLIPLTYCIYGLIGSRLLKGKSRQLPVFMIFTELLILWGNYSLYTAETFLMTRTRQGKAALGNIVVPAFFFLVYLAGERLVENKKVEKSLWMLLFCLTTFSCLCSTFGGFLTAVLFGAFGLCALITYKRWRLLLPLVFCLLPAAVYMGMYMILK